jgi:DNA replication ATP-dependent helicase Dna2
MYTHFHPRSPNVTQGWGDDRQLAPIFQSKHPDAKKCLGVSMFEYMNATNRCFLNEQSRMTEDICNLISDIYEGKLTVAEGCEQEPEWRANRRVLFVSGIGTERIHLEECPQEGDFKKTKYGQGTRFKSAEYIGRLVPQLSSTIGQENIFVLTPYRAQRALIKTFLKNSGQKKVTVSTVHRAQGSEYHTVIFDPVIASGERLLGDPEEGLRLINVALSRAKARLIIIMSRGDRANEHLRRIAHSISGEGRFDEAVPLKEIAILDGFPANFVGKIVRWEKYVGPIEQHQIADSFYINDFISGERKRIKTEVVRAICSRTADSPSNHQEQ